jgi:general secretion pathway protein D
MNLNRQKTISRMAIMNKFNKLMAVICWVTACLILSSCELINPRPTPLIPLPPVSRQLPPEKPTGIFKELQNKPRSDETMAPKSELYPGTGQSVSSTAPSHRRAGSGEAGSYSLNFDEADLGEVAKVILSDILGQNYVLSPKVAGKVTLQTSQPLTKEELLPTLEMVLRMNNAALVKDGKIYHIEPATEALYSSDISTGSRSGYQTRVIPVKNVAVENMMEVIKPLLHDKTILHVDGSRNILVASGTPDELARVLDMVSTFDIDILRGRSFGLFPLAHVEPETIIEELEAVFNKKGKAEDSNFFRFIAIDRLNAVMAITHQARYLNEIENWVRRLDKANSASGGGVNVYRVQHADAEELADTLNEIFTGAQKKEKSAKVAPGQKATEITSKASDKPESKKSSAGNSSTGDSKVANVGEVRIIADKANNSVVVVATAREYETINAVINQLDVTPLQVLIDATIVSVALTNDLKYGISWYLTHGRGNDAIASTATPPGEVARTLGTAAQAATAAATGGFSAIYSSGAVKALLNAQATADNLNVISSPSLMVLNNQQAKINVGDQVPIQTSTTQVPISGGTAPSIAQTSSIQYIDTGVTLEVTPRVNANGMVIMEIKQVVSNAKPSTTGVTSTVTIAKKEVESFVAVHDGETIVLGGLIDDNNSVGKSGIPFLHSLPWIGSLFGTKDFRRTKTELVILITPRVVKSTLDSRLVTDEFKRKLTGIYQDYPASSINRRVTR